MILDKGSSFVFFYKALLLPQNVLLEIPSISIVLQHICVIKSSLYYAWVCFWTLFYFIRILPIFTPVPYFLN